MFGSNHRSRDALVSEIAICDLGLVQILIPTEQRWVNKENKTPAFSTIPDRQRVYRDHGWVFYRDHIIGHFAGLRLQSPSPSGTPQLALGQSLSFEISTEHPVPDAIAQRASFLYQFNPSPTLHHALLQDLIPRFMRIYAFRSTASLVRLVHNFLQEENAIFGV